MLLLELITQILLEKSAGWNSIVFYTICHPRVMIMTITITMYMIMLTIIYIFPLLYNIDTFGIGLAQIIQK